MMVYVLLKEVDCDSCCCGYKVIEVFKSKEDADAECIKLDKDAWLLYHMVEEWEVIE